MNYLKLVVALFLVLSSSSAFSEGSETLTPTAVGCMPAGICYIVVDPPVSVTACTNKTQIRLDMSLPGSSAQYSAALSAVMAGKNINAYITDTCASNYPITPSWLHVMK